MALFGSSPSNLNSAVCDSVADSGSLVGSPMKIDLASHLVFKNSINSNEKDVENSALVSGHGSNMGVAFDGDKISSAASLMSSDPSLGVWMTTSLGSTVTTHIIHIGVGENVASEQLRFAQQRARALCIMFANGLVSDLTLLQPGSSSDSVTHEGCFRILSISGTYFPSQVGGPHSQTGGLAIMVNNHDGQVLGGVVGVMIITAIPVQLCVWCWKKVNSLHIEAKADNDHDVQPTENSSTPDGEGSVEDISPNSEESRFSPTCPGTGAQTLKST